MFCHLPLCSFFPCFSLSLTFIEWALSHTKWQGLWKTAESFAIRIERGKKKYRETKEKKEKLVAAIVWVYGSQSYLRMTHENCDFCSGKKAFWNHYSSPCGCALIWNKACRVGVKARKGIAPKLNCKHSFYAGWKPNFNWRELSGSCIGVALKKGIQ